MTDVITRFLQYVQIDTRSEEGSAQSPSTPSQHDLAKLLFNQLSAMGLETYYDTEHCYVYAQMHANTGAAADTKAADADAHAGKPLKLGFIAHMDTSPEVSGAGVKPRIVHYGGGDIVLNEEKNIILKAAEFPGLAACTGKDLIVTDGTTLLGADDKAGVAEIMAFIAYLKENPQIPHGELRFAFTPDEEIGCGTDFFDLERFDADVAYTLDGGPLGEIEYENFNAASAKVTVRGRSVHPGEAKNKMINALLVAAEYNDLIPKNEIPATTEGYEGFYHLNGMAGAVESAKLHYIIRDHDRTRFEERKKFMEDAAAQINAHWGKELVRVEIEDSYYNMREIIEQHMELIDCVREAMEELGITPKTVPIRGGTDGARLSFEGLPCPNLCTGGRNYHSRYEYACAQEMEQIVELLVKLAGKLINKPV